MADSKCCAAFLLYTFYFFLTPSLQLSHFSFLFFPTPTVRFPSAPLPMPPMFPSCNCVPVSHGFFVPQMTHIPTLLLQALYRILSPKKKNTTKDGAKKASRLRVNGRVSVYTVMLAGMDSPAEEFRSPTRPPRRVTLTQVLTSLKTSSLFSAIHRLLSFVVELC